MGREEKENSGGTNSKKPQFNGPQQCGKKWANGCKKFVVVALETARKGCGKKGRDRTKGDRGKKVRLLKAKWKTKSSTEKKNGRTGQSGLTELSTKTKKEKKPDIGTNVAIPPSGDGKAELPNKDRPS